jgi:hypothetical protein
MKRLRGVHPVVVLVLLAALITGTPGVLFADGPDQTPPPTPVPPGHGGGGRAIGSGWMWLLDVYTTVSIL